MPMYILELTFLIEGFVCLRTFTYNRFIRINAPDTHVTCRNGPIKRTIPLICDAHKFLAICSYIISEHPKKYDIFYVDDAFTTDHVALVLSKNILVSQVSLSVNVKSNDGYQVHMLSYRHYLAPS